MKWGCLEIPDSPICLLNSFEKSHVLFVSLFYILPAGVRISDGLMYDQ